MKSPCQWIQKSVRIKSRQGRPRHCKTGTLAKLCEEKSVIVKKLRSERDSSATLHRELLSSIRLVVKPREERMGKVFVKLCKFYDEGCKAMEKTHVEEMSDLWEIEVFEE